MRIVIDMQGAQTGSRHRGIGRYTVSLVKALVAEPGDHQILLAVNDSLEDSASWLRREFADLVPAERIAGYTVPARVSWDDPANGWRRQAAERIREEFLASLCPDIVLISSLFEGIDSTDAVISVGAHRKEFPTAVVLYDLIPLLKPEIYLQSEQARRWYMDKIENMKRADLLLSISEHSREEGIAGLQFDAAHVVNISTAHSRIFHPVQLCQTDRAALNSRYGILGSYVMYNGALDPRKNLDRLIEAFAALPDTLRCGRQLLFAGRVSDSDRIRLRVLAKQYGIDGRLVLTGHVPDDDLVALFAGCELFVFPSIHEGFGLPALEAMACGAPTIGSRLTSVPEVIGRSDALFDPLDTREIMELMRSALVDKGFRESLRAHAVVQAGKFSWQVTAQRALAALERFQHRALPAITGDPDRKASYRGLLESIARIPGPSPDDRSLMGVAACIAGNGVQGERQGSVGNPC